MVIQMKQEFEHCVGWHTLNPLINLIAFSYECECRTLLTGRSFDPTLGQKIINVLSELSLQ